MVTVVKNRALLPLWLLVLRMIAERSRTDLEFAARCGGILAGVMPSHRGMSPDLAVKTMLQPPEAWSFGGRLADALPSAVALELFHNAFLVHDDIEDESIHRRGASTIHEKYGVAIAINVGDALSVLTMTPLLQDLEVMGLQRALRVFREIEHMGRQSVDGQAMELEWVKNRTWNLTDRQERISGHERERVIAIFSKDRSERTGYIST